MALSSDELAAFAELGIYEPDPHDQLHVRLLDVIRRNRGTTKGHMLVAVQWVMNWDLGRQGAEFAEARSEFELLKAMQVIRHRDAGEKSGAMAETRAMAEPDVAKAYLRYRVAEQAERLARKRLDTIGNSIDVWRAENANARAADLMHAKEGT